jgi:hypothetical protein
MLHHAVMIAPHCLAETSRTIFRPYLELKSFGKLVAELDRRGIVTKRRNTKVIKYLGGIPFTCGPLAYFLKNRVYPKHSANRAVVKQFILRQK